MKTFTILLLIAALMLCACTTIRTNENQFALNQVPFKNYNWSVLGFGSYSVTIVDKNFVPVSTVVDGSRTTYTYQNQRSKWLEILITIDEKPDKNNPFLTLKKEDVIYQKLDRLNVVIFRQNFISTRLYGVSVLKYRDVGDKKIYVEFRTERDSEYRPIDANHLIAIFDTYINMTNEGRIVLEAPPCPLEIFEHTK